MALLTQAERRLARAEVRLVLVGGLPGTGKTTVALALAQGLPGASGAEVDAGFDICWQCGAARR